MANVDNLWEWAPTAPGERVSGGRFRVRCGKMQGERRGVNKLI